MPEKPHISWVVKPPKYPCITGKGLCMLRHTDSKYFDCENKTKDYCKYRVTEEEEN